MAEHDDQPGGLITVRPELDAAEHHLVVHGLRAGPEHEQIPHATVEDNLGRNTRIDAGKDQSERILVGGDRLPALDRLVRMLQLPVHPALVSLHQQLQCLPRVRPPRSRSCHQVLQPDRPRPCTPPESPRPAGTVAALIAAPWSRLPAHREHQAGRSPATSPRPAPARNPAPGSCRAAPPVPSTPPRTSRSAARSRLACLPIRDRRPEPNRSA